MTGTTGTLIWHHTSVVVDNLDHAIAFHREQFGFEVTLEARGLSEAIQRMLALSGITCDLVQGISPVSGHILELIEFHHIPEHADARLPIWPGRSHLAFVVPDLAAALTSIADAGGKPVGQASEFSEGPAVYCWTPAGTVVELEQWHQPPSTETSPMTAKTRQRIVVFGGAGGIGSAVAEAAAHGGASVWIADVRNANEAVDALPGSEHRSVEADVTDPAGVEALISHCWQQGGADGVVYAPGLLHTGHVADIAGSDIKRVFSVNLLGAFAVGQALARQLRAEPRPVSVVFVSSVAGLHGEAGGALYCATKFGLIGFMQSFAAEIADFGCRANAVCPGNVDTPMLHSLASQLAARAGITPENMVAQLAEATAFRRLLTPAEVASACMWLLSPAASAISGQAIVVDGPPPQAHYA